MAVFSTNNSTQNRWEKGKSFSEKIQSTLIFTQGRQMGLAGLGLWARLSHLDIKHLFENLVESGEVLVAAQRRNAFIRREENQIDARADGKNEWEVLRNDFLEAADRIRSSSKKIPRGLWLDFYALYKQANHGDISGKRPSVRAFVARARYAAWAQKKSMTDTEAMRTYIEKVENLFDAD